MPIKHARTGHWAAFNTASRYRAVSDHQLCIGKRSRLEIWLSRIVCCGMNYEVARINVVLYFETEVARASIDFLASPSMNLRVLRFYKNDQWHRYVLESLE